MGCCGGGRRVRKPGKPKPKPKPPPPKPKKK